MKRLITLFNPTIIAAVFVVLAHGPVALGQEAAPSGSGDLTELSIEDLMNVTVYGASRFEQKELNAPSAVTVISADEITKYGYRTLADLLRSVRGLYVTYDRNYSYLGVRGFNRPGDTNSRILLLLDGHRLTENIFDSSYLGTDFILDVDLIDRVEIIRGPGSSLYGSNAFFAVVNVITKQPGRVKGKQASAEAGSPYTYKGRVTFGDNFANGLDMMLSGSVLRSKGWPHLYFQEFDDPATNNGVAENKDADRNHSLFTKFLYKDFTLEGAYVSRTKDIPTASYESIFNGPTEQTTDNLGTVDLKYERFLSGGLSVLARANYNRYIYKGTFPLISPAVINRDDTLGEWIGAEVLATKTLWSKHKLSAGSEYRDNLKQNTKNFDENPLNIRSEIRKKSRTYAFFIQDEYTISPTLLVNAGDRYDHYEGFGGTTNPRLALIYSPFARSSFKLIHGSAFRAPNIWETDYADNVTNPNPLLRPERIATEELVYEQQFGKNMMLTVDTYYNKIRDLISEEDDPADPLKSISLNKGEVRAYGAELELEGRYQSGLIWRASFAHQRTKDNQSGRELDNSPRYLGKLNLSLPLLRDSIYGGIETQYSSSAAILDSSRADAYMVTNVTLFTQKMMKGLEASAGIYNIFNESYGQPGFTQHVTHDQDNIQQDGRTYRVKLTYVF